MTAVEIKTEYITLAQFLKFAGAVMSGGEAKELILSGAVRVNGEVCEHKGAKLRGGETVSVGEKTYEVRRCT